MRRFVSRQHAQRMQRGFTLIEVMIASVFFAISITAIFTLNARASKTMIESRNYDRATSLILNMSELVQVLAPAQVQTLLATSNGKGYDINGNPLKNSSKNAFYTMNMSIIASSGTYKHLMFKVTWTDPGTTKPHVVTSEALVNLP